MVLSSRPPPRVPYTYQAYRHIPDDGRRWELMEGELYVTPAPSPFHQTVSRRLQYALMQALELPGIALIFNAPCDVILADTTVVQPDLAVVSCARRSIITARGIEGPPELVVEILSPSSKGQDEFLKRTVYAHFGIGEYWLVDPDHGFVEALKLLEQGYETCARLDRASTLCSLTFPQVAIALEPIFRPLV